jgi:signal transduction histidine kinase
MAPLRPRRLSFRDRIGRRADSTSALSPSASIVAPRSRYSLRLRVFGAIALAGVAPLLFVIAWSQIDRGAVGQTWRTTLDAANLALTTLGNRSVDAARADLTQIARRRHVRLRIVAPTGEVPFDEDADDPTDALHPIEAFLFDPSESPPLRELDEPMGPILLRPEVAAARANGTYVACSSPGPILCQAIRLGGAAGSLVYVQKSSSRAVEAVATLRQQLLRLGLVTVPLILLLAYSTGRRIVSPIEELRRQALAKANDANRAADLPVHKDEVGDLGAALNALLSALAARGAQNEAFVADLVHELKSPVAAVRASADALEEGTLDGDRRARLARILGDSAAKLDQLVTQFLELARAEAGMPDEARSEIDLAALAHARVERIAEDERFSGIAFAAEENAPEGIPLVVAGVEHRLDALVRELLENAASFTPPGGLVVAEVGAENGMVVLSVRDSGPGIAAEDLPRVFDRFFTTRGKRRGTGLGLALARAVAEAHGGELRAESPPGGGARFELRVPSRS